MKDIEPARSEYLQKILRQTAIIIPWSGEPSRVPGFRYVTKWYATKFPGVTFYIKNSNHRPFNVSASRNIATDKAIKDGKNIIYQADADSVVAEENFIESIVYAYESDSICYPYNMRVHCQMSDIDLAFTSEFAEHVIQYKNGTYIFIYKGKKFKSQHNHVRPALASYDLDLPCAAPFAMSKTFLQKVGSHDENFKGYGSEDIDYYVKIQKNMNGKPKKLDGIAASIDHIRDTDNEDVNYAYLLNKLSL